ncbi:MAG: sulfatase [Halanaerobiales bacterium]
MEIKNILYIHTHDTGRYIQPYGYNVPTPNLMKLAKEGTTFRQAYSVAPTCSPSRVGLLTGMSPHTAGMLGLAHRGFADLDYKKHLVQYLNREGFKTVLCGMQHEAPRSEMIGYQEILDSEDDIMNDEKNAKRVADYIQRETGRNNLFLSFGMEYTHRPYPEPAEEINPDYLRSPFPVYDNRQTREDMAGFHTSVRNADSCIGMVLNALAESELAENTLIIYTTDHGIAFPRMKCNLYDTGVGVSLIMKYPGNKREGETVDALVSQLDIFPTICDLFRLRKPEWLQGRTIYPLLQKETEKIREQIFTEVTYHAAYQPMRSVRTERYKLIRYFDEQGVVPANIDDSLSKEFLIEHGYLNQLKDNELLFDLYFDPVERVNLMGDEKYQQIYEDLSSRLEAWMRDTGDPLLEGKVEKPSGAVVNKIGSLSAELDEYE